MIIKNALVFTLEQGFVEKDIVIENGYFTGEQKETKTDEKIFDAAGNYLIPGLVDIHFHGCAGYDFSDVSPVALEKIGAYELRNGITSICPAAMTSEESVLKTVCENAYQYRENRENKSASRLCGIHLEGPFISAKKKGAQNSAYIHMPDVEMYYRLQKAAHGLIRLVTIAPEVDRAKEFIQSLKSEVHISIGHTVSDYEDSCKAFSLGADHVTHLFNAMTEFTHRAPGIIGAAYDEKHVMVELICDGVHVHPSAVRMAFELFGKERIILISDSMRATGMEDGVYSLGGLSVNVTGSLATLEDGTIAGSVTNLMQCMRTAVSMGIPLETAVRCATYNPAKSIGVEDVCGQIAEGMYGDCVILSKEDLSIEEVILGGEKKCHT